MHTTRTTNLNLETTTGQVTLALLCSLLVFGYFGLQWNSPKTFLAAAAVPFALTTAIRYPSICCMLFLSISYFRIHEAYPFLHPFRLPLATGSLALAGLIWHTVIIRSITPIWPKELKLFASFFCLVTIGLLFSLNRMGSLESWQNSFIKISAMMIAIAWLLRRPQDFTIALRTFVISALLVSIIAIVNKIYGIGLVEGTRIALGTEDALFGTIALKRSGTPLSDPNDLAFILLCPLCFSLSMLFGQKSSIDRFLGVVTAPAILATIIFTQSRGAIIGIVCMLLIALRRFTRSSPLLLAIPLIAGALLFIVMGISDRVSGGLQDYTDGGIDSSAQARIYAWIAATRMAIENPFTGIGLDNSASHYFAYTPVWEGINKATHSIWFQTLGEFGFLGLAIYVTYIFAAYQSINTNLKHLSQRHAPPSVITLARGLYLSLVALCAAGSFLSQATTWPIHMTVAMIAALSIFARQLDQSPGIRQFTSHHPSPNPIPHNQT